MIFMYCFMITNPYSYISLVVTKNELKSQDVKLTLFWPLLSIRKLTVQTCLGALPDFRNLTLLQCSKIRVEISK